jgi:hypothetical protein
MTNMNVDTDVDARKWSDLEKYVIDSKETEFPVILSSERENTKSYPGRYIDFITQLGADQDNVEYENTLSSFRDELNKLSSGGLNNMDAIKDIYNNIMVLTKHGKGHVESVMIHASGMLKYKKNDEVKWRIKPFEAFILLCAIQIHDLGNKHGREKHTTSFYNKFLKYANISYITSDELINCIYRIARVHGGKIEGDKDTIEKAILPRKKAVDNIDVNQQFLAAILRFSDELADDQNRAKKIDNMPEFCKVYHSYSSALHTARIEENEMNDGYSVRLGYFLKTDEALKHYKKLDENGNIEEIKLIDEIFYRTIKMERERRYCSRYFYPFLQINEIIVEIDILTTTFETHYLRYTLPAKGYPIEDICIPDREKFISQIMENSVQVKDTIQEGLNTYGQE